MTETSGGESPQPKPPDKPKEQRIAQYDVHDLPPYTIIVESKEKNLGNVHPTAVGKILKNNSVNGIRKITRKGRNRIGIDFITTHNANNFLKNKILQENNWDAFIPASLISVKGIVRGIGIETTTEEIISEGVSAKPIIAARRLNRRVTKDNTVEYVPTETIVITFRGKRLPESILVNYYEVRVQIYVDPVLQCLNCLRYGHTKTHCRSKRRCALCSYEHEEEECQAEIKACLYCKQNHKATDRQCKEYQRQKDIKELMVYDNISYYEAKQRFPNHTETESTHINYTHNNRDFPPLTPRANQEQVIEVHQRRQHINQSKPRIQFSQICTPERKRKPSSPPVGYDKEAHKKMLIPTPCRSPNYTHVQQDNEKDTEQTTETIDLSLFFRNILEQANVEEDTIERILNEMNKIENALGKNEENQPTFNTNVDMEIEVDRSLNSPTSSVHTSY